MAAGEICNIDWHVAPFRADRWYELWYPSAAKMPAYGAVAWSLTRSVDDPLAFRQSALWPSRADFERYWFSGEIEAAREEVIDLYDKPLLPTWHTLLAAE
ncbi:MAG: hypothetical protein U0R52_08235 [Solirubrobacterales bacterium]